MGWSCAGTKSHPRLRSSFYSVFITLNPFFPLPSRFSSRIQSREAGQSQNKSMDGIRAGGKATKARWRWNLPKSRKIFPVLAFPGEKTIPGPSPHPGLSFPAPAEPSFGIIPDIPLCRSVPQFPSPHSRLWDSPAARELGAEGWECAGAGTGIRLLPSGQEFPGKLRPFPGSELVGMLLLLCPGDFPAPASLGNVPASIPPLPVPSRISSRDSRSLHSPGNIPAPIPPVHDLISRRMLPPRFPLSRFSREILLPRFPFSL